MRIFIAEGKRRDARVRVQPTMHFPPLRSARLVSPELFVKRAGALGIPSTIFLIWGRGREGGRLSHTQKAYKMGAFSSF